MSSTVVICASRDSSSDLILKSIRSGAREFLRLPVDGEEFATVIDRTAEFAAARTKEPKNLVERSLSYRARVVAVIPL